MEEEGEEILLDLSQMRDRVSKLEETFAKLAKRFKLKFNPRQRPQTTRNSEDVPSIIERQNGSRMPPTSAGRNGNGVAKPRGNAQGVNQPPIITENVEVCQFDTEHQKRDSATESTSSISAAAAISGVNDVVYKDSNELGVISPTIEQEKFRCNTDNENDPRAKEIPDGSVFAPKKKSTTATKSCYLNSKTPFVSVKRLSFIAAASGVNGSGSVGAVHQKSRSISINAELLIGQEVRFSAEHYKEESKSSIPGGSATITAQQQNEEKMPSTSAAENGIGVVAHRSNIQGVNQHPIIATDVEQQKRDSATEGNSSISGATAGSNVVVDKESKVGINPPPPTIKQEEVCFKEEHENDSEKEEIASISGGGLGASSIDRQNEERTPSPAAAGEEGGVISKEPYNLGVIPPPVKTENDEVCQCKSEDKSDCDCSSEEGDLNSSIPGGSESRKAQQQNRRSSRNKSVKTSSFGLKSPIITRKRLSAKILPKKKKEILPVAKRPKWKCPHCPKILPSKSHFERHIRSHTGKRPFHCPHCPKTTSLAGNLRVHIRTVHPWENQNLLPCRICQKKFKSRRTRTAHMKKHLSCYFCSRKLKNFQTLGNHLSTHTGEKPVKCPRCFYSTSLEGNLDIHIIRKHLKAKLTFFRRCFQKRCTWKNLRNVGGELSCYFCSYKTIFSTDFIQHLRIHTKERPFNCPCPRCSYSTKTNGALNQHFKI